MERGHPAWLAHDRRGTGEPLVLVHGLGSHRGVFDPLLDTLTPYRDVITLDLPGFGGSPVEPGPVGVAALATRVEAFLAALDLAGPHLGGSSLGGAVALELGRRGTARSVVAFAPAGFWGTAGRLWCRLLLRGARGLARTLGPATPAVVRSPWARRLAYGAFYARPGRLTERECLAGAAALAGASGFEATCAALTARPRSSTPDTGALARIPVTVAWGTRDVLLPYRYQARRARTALPCARHVALPGCGHLPFADDPDTCARLLLDGTATGGGTRHDPAV